MLRVFRGFFLVAYGKKSLEEILFKMLPTARNQSSELRWIFLVAYGKKSLEEIFNEIWPLARNQSSSEFKRILDGNKIFNQNP